MKFKAKKSYGNYKTSTCPFCNRTATHKNEQGLDVCLQHKSESLEDFRCTCGSWLEARSGKFGPYFNCINCGNMNYNKAMEIKSMTSNIKFSSEPEKPKYNQTKSIDQTKSFERKKVEAKPEIKKSLAELEREELRRKYYNKDNSSSGKKVTTITSDDPAYFS